MRLEHHNLYITIKIPLLMMSPDLIDRILKPLPEPRSVHVHVIGAGVDYSSASASFHEEFPLLKFIAGSRLVTLRIENPTKELLSKIYHAYHNGMGKENSETMSRLQLESAYFLLPKGGHIEVRETEVKIEYEGERPNCITDLEDIFTGVQGVSKTVFSRETRTEVMYQMQ